MITVTVEKRYGENGDTKVRARISALTIERAVQIPGDGARLVLPIKGETFFAPVEKEGIDFGAMTSDQVEAAVDAGLQGAYDAWLQRLMDQMDLIEDSNAASTPQAQAA